MTGEDAAEAGSTEVVAVFGGSFNPPHIGHVLAVAYVLSCQAVDRCLIIPTYRHPFAKALTPFEDRLEMCRRAFAPLGAAIADGNRTELVPTARVLVSTVERELGGDSLTVRTLEHLTTRHPTWHLRLVLGTDVVHELAKWNQPDRIRSLAPLLVLGRMGVHPPVGYEHLPHVLPAISSTEIRSALGQGLNVDGLVPHDVLSYVRQRRLYTTLPGSSIRGPTAS